MNLIFRKISKLLFALVIIGFLMPMACDSNGFGIAHSKYVKGGYTFALYALFFTALAGLIIGVLLFFRKKIPVLIDWLIIVACMCSGLIPFFINVKRYSRNFQSGTYTILTAFALILITQVISAIRREKRGE